MGDPHAAGERVSNVLKRLCPAEAFFFLAFRRKRRLIFSEHALLQGKLSNDFGILAPETISLVQYMLR
ncbi:hypothetical protein I656_03884 [Geobacillus sp. WSUCF1]|nr:hypothetical protein I656_03884 [Geobacillus sp. WSUCF1]